MCAVPRSFRSLPATRCLQAPPFIVHSPLPFAFAYSITRQDSAAAPLPFPLFDTYRVPDRLNLCRLASHMTTPVHTASAGSGAGQMRWLASIRGTATTCSHQRLRRAQQLAWHAPLEHTGMACDMAMQGCTHGCVAATAPAEGAAAMPRCWVWYSSPRQPPSAQLALPTRLQPSLTASAPPCKQNLVSKQLAPCRRRAQPPAPR